MMMIALALVLAPFALADSQHLTWNVDGTTREALVFVPPLPPPEARLPLVLVFHGFSSNMTKYAEHTAMLHAEWPDAVVVYMQGLPSPNRSGRGMAPGWQLRPGEQGDRDLRFVDVALSALRQKYRIDDNRIYATGFSQGAYFTLLLWAQRGQTFAAFAACAVSLLPGIELKPPRPYLQISGEGDQGIPFTRQSAAIEAIRRVNGATGAGEACGLGCTRYVSPAGATVMMLVYEGGHTYPPGASARIVAFFKEQVRR